MTVETVTIDTSDENKGPSVEESYEELKKEGLINEEHADGGDTNSGGQGDDGVEAGADERPSWLPEKFKSAEDMAKAYAELEKKQSSGETEGSTEDASDGSEAEARETVENAGLDFDAFTTEYNENGELSAASFEALDKAGIPRAVVDAYISGLEVQAEVYEGKVFSAAGGADEYASMIKWGGENLSEAEIDAFDKAVNSGDLDTATVAVKGLYAQMQLAQGVAPKVQLDGKGGSSNDVYESQAQMEADMNDPRYQTDEAFRQKVYAKLARSEI